MPEPTNKQYTINPATSNVTFGTDAAEIKLNGAAQAIGYAQSASAEQGSDVWECRDGNGNVVATVNYNTNGQVQCSLVLFAGTGLPKPGDKLSVGGRLAIIQSANVAWSNQEGTKVDLTGKWYAGIPVA